MCARFHWGRGGSREKPVLHHHALFKSEDIKEDALATYKAVRLSENIRPVLERPHHLQVITFARELAKFFLKPFKPVGY